MKARQTDFMVMEENVVDRESNRPVSKTHRIKPKSVMQTDVCTAEKRQSAETMKDYGTNNQPE